MSDSPERVFTIRHHKPGDRPALLKLLEAAMLETYPDLKHFTRSEMRERVEAEFAHYFALPEKEIWVAEVDGEVGGCLWCMESFHPVTGMSDFFVVNVAIFPDYRGFGLARKLFEEAITSARARGLPCVRLFVNPANDAAYRLYVRMGFLPQTHEMRLDLTGDGS